jgi:hypothetical protein
VTSRWDAANEARTASAEQKRARLAAVMPSCRTYKEAAWRTGIPERTASRLLRAIDRE